MEGRVIPIAKVFRFEAISLSLLFCLKMPLQSLFQLTVIFVQNTLQNSFFVVPDFRIYPTVYFGSIDKNLKCVEEQAWTQ